MTRKKPPGAGRAVRRAWKCLERVPELRLDAVVRGNVLRVPEVERRIEGEDTLAASGQRRGAGEGIAAERLWVVGVRGEVLRAPAAVQDVEEVENVDLQHQV